MHGGDILMWLLSSNATGTCHLSLDTETSRSCSISGSQKSVYLTEPLLLRSRKTRQRLKKKKLHLIKVKGNVSSKLTLNKPLLQSIIYLLSLSDLHPQPFM